MMDYCLRALATQWQALIDAAISAGLLTQDEETGNIQAVSGAWDYMGTVSVRTGGTDEEPVYETLKDGNGVEYLHANLRTDLPAAALSGYYVERDGQPALPVRPRRVFAGTEFTMPAVVIDNWAPEALAEIPAPELPTEGWLEVGDVYRHGDQLLIVRQSHNRTHFDPSDTPALFMIKNTTENWIAGEQVQVGTRRMFDGVWYEAIQAHVTQADWTPPTVPALWAAVSAPPVEPPPSATWVDTGATVTGQAGQLYYVSQPIASLGITAGQAIRLGAAETTYVSTWAGTDNLMQINPSVAASTGAKVWKWA